MAAEQQGAAEWLFDTLTADAALAAALGQRVHHDLAPQGTAATYPLVVYSHAGGVDLMTVSTSRVLSDQAWLVKIVDRSTSYATAGSLYNRVDDVLHNNAGTALYGRVYAAVRLTTVQFTEVTDGVQYRHVGGTYRLIVQDV